MTELEYIRERYKNRSHIEISGELQHKIFEWVIGPIKDGQSDVRKQVGKFCERGFIKFLDKGVVIVKASHNRDSIRVYPFEFLDNGLLEMSIYIYDIRKDMDPKKWPNPLSLLCKVHVDLTTTYTVLRDTYDDELARVHLAEEFNKGKASFNELQGIIKVVRERNPDIIPNSEEWNRACALEYYNHVIKAQIITVIAVNTYLSLLEKEILITKIEQKRPLSTGKGIKQRHKRNPLYRYQVELPPNYKPRKSIANYILSKWERSGHVRKAWVLEENAETLLARKPGAYKALDKNGQWLRKPQEDKVAIWVPISPKTCHRRTVSLPENIGTKDYSEQ